MADRLSKLRDFLVFQARQRPSLLGPDGKTPNSRALAERLGVNQATVWKILTLKRNTRSDGDRIMPLREYRPTQELIDGMMGTFGYTSESELWEAILAAPPAGALAKRKTYARRRRKKLSATRR